MASGDENRRQYERIPVNVSARISPIDPERQEGSSVPVFRLFTKNDLCVNLSRGGALLVASQGISRGARVLLELYLEGEEPVNAIGRIVRDAPAPTESRGGGQVGLAVEFIDNSQSLYSALQEFVESVGTADAGRLGGYGN